MLEPLWEDKVCCCAALLLMRPDGALIKEMTVKLDSESGT